MTVVARAHFGPASRAQHDQLDAAINARLTENGGSPDGLLAMVTYPQGDGFDVVQVFRDEETLTKFVQGVCLPAIAELAVDVGSLDVDPVWSFMQP